MLPDYMSPNDEVNYRYNYNQRTSLEGDDAFLIENGERAITVAESEDPCASYSYDDFALILLDKKYYVVETSGCSCPSPGETWECLFSGTWEETRDFLESSYTRDSRAGKVFSYNIYQNSSALMMFMWNCQQAGFQFNLTLHNPTPDNSKF